MTEADWLAGRVSLYSTLRRRNFSSRKVRLFACACCRDVWPLIGDARSRRAVEVAERFADGLASRKDLAAARASCPARGDGSAANWAAKAVVQVTAPSAGEAARQASFNALHAISDGDFASTREHRQFEILKDIVGNPYRRPVIDPAWLAWHDGTVVKLAQAIYDERRFADLPILADALLDAGCTDAAMLSHCRTVVGHVRGCWLLDALLGKK
jgi:hypothetical protein